MFCLTKLILGVNVIGSSHGHGSTAWPLENQYGKRLKWDLEKPISLSLSPSLSLSLPPPLPTPFIFLWKLNQYSFFFSNIHEIWLWSHGIPREVFGCPHCTLRRRIKSSTKNFIPRRICVSNLSFFLSPPFFFFIENSGVSFVSKGAWKFSKVVIWQIHGQTSAHMQLAH